MGHFVWTQWLSQSSLLHFTWVKLKNNNLDIITFQSVDALKELYKDVDDIDLFVGMMHEKVDKDGLVGKTFQ